MYQPRPSPTKWTTIFRERLLERWWDIRDWIDFRPDPGFWVVAALISVLVAGTFAIPPFVVAVILAAAVAIAILLLLVSLTLIAILVAVRATLDVLRTRTPRKPTAKNTASLHRVGPIAKVR